MIGNRIKQRRNELKMSQEKLAELTGYKTKGAISRIENGKIDLSQSQISTFAKALLTTEAELMGWNSEDEDKMEMLRKLLDDEQQELVKNYNMSSEQGKQIILDTSRNISKAYPIISRQEMIDYLKEIPLAAYDGNINIHTATDEELYNLYKIIKEDDDE